MTLHTMTLVCSHEGTNEFLCPDCGRQELIEILPEWRHVVLMAGDESAGHTGWMEETEEEVEDTLPPS